MTKIFVPTYQYPDGIAVEVSDGEYSYDAASQILTVKQAAGSDTHSVVVTPK